MNTRIHKSHHKAHVRFAQWNSKTIEDLLRRGKTREQIMIRLQVPSSEVDKVAQSL